MKNSSSKVVKYAKFGAKWHKPRQVMYGSLQSFACDTYPRWQSLCVCTIMAMKCSQLSLFGEQLQIATDFCPIWNKNGSKCNEIVPNDFFLKSNKNRSKNGQKSVSKNEKLCLFGEQLQITRYFCSFPRSF